MKTCTPESVGISSADVLKFYQKLDERCLSTHDVIMARGSDIFTETYYEPFHKDFLHRMYSVSKSFVSIAVGFCEQDGLLNLDDPFTKYFSEYVKEGELPKATSVTLREMLRMETGRFGGSNWFDAVDDDRCAVYLDIFSEKYPNTLFDYDSFGSYMLGAVVERVTGKKFMDYLKDKVLRDIGFSEESYCLMAPGKHSWGDSGVMCTARDLLLFARFVLNGGTWNGKRYLNEEYIRKATDTKICNNHYGFENPSGYGYGYQFWGLPHGCYAMFGMGIQLAVCDPKHDLVFVINSDNQGNEMRYAPIIYSFFDYIYDRMGDAPLAEDEEAYRRLMEYTSTRKLFVLRGETKNDFGAKIAGKTYLAEPNPMGIKWLRLEFEGDEGVLHYENEQGVKSLQLGFGHNVFQKFPQVGYSDLVGAKVAPGNRYDCAVSADWPEAQKLRIRVQIIDKYFGNLAILLGFRDEEHVSVRMEKCAEDFLKEYSGLLNAQTNC